MLGGNQPGYRDIPDALVEEFIEAHPNGGTIQEIASVMGVTRERAYQILRKALAKCQRACKERDLTPADVPCRTTTWDRLESS